MNEIEKRELKGLGGWLVLFQIHIFNSLASIIQVAVLVPIMSFIFNSSAMKGLYGLPDGYPFNIFDFLYSPPAVAIIAVIFVLTLLCIIFFYRKKMVFRVLFIIQSVISLVGLVLYYIFAMSRMYAEILADIPQVADAFVYIGGAFAIIPTLGITVALIIALFKSHRVKNTFS